MITKDSIETAYSFLHQKQRIYVHSTLDWQKDDIEIAIASYADEMSQELLDVISGGIRLPGQDHHPLRHIGRQQHQEGLC